MANSSGARPRKAHRDEVMRLRALLSEVPSSQWQRAHAIFRDICSMCDHQGPKGGTSIPYPRSCRYCHYYGHSSQFCPKRRVQDMQDTDRILQAERLYRAKSKQQPTTDKMWLAEFERLQARYNAAHEAGLEGCIETWDNGGVCSDRGIPLGKRCAGCEEWNAFVVQWERRNEP